VSTAVTPVLAQTDDGKPGDDGGGLDGVIEGVLDGHGLVGAPLVLVGGVVLLTVCVEKLISCRTRAALGLRLSLFAFAIVFTGSSSTTPCSTSSSRRAISKEPRSEPASPSSG
jgi:cation:H+ antiporter